MAAVEPVGGLRHAVIDNAQGSIGGFFQGHGQRLFHKDMLTCGGRRGNQSAMICCGRRNHDRIYKGICKNLFLTNRQRTAFYLLLMPGHKPFRTKDLSHQIGSARLSFASPEHMLELLDIAPGSVSVLGLMNDHDGRVRLLIDRDLLQDAYLCCHPCINTSTLKLRMADAIDVLIPALAHAPTYVDLPVYEPQT